MNESEKLNQSDILNRKQETTIFGHKFEVGVLKYQFVDILTEDVSSNAYKQSPQLLF